MVLKMHKDTYIRNNKVPDLLLDLIAEGKWLQPSKHQWETITPWLKEPIDQVDLLLSLDKMQSESRGLDYLTGLQWSICSSKILTHYQDHSLWLNADKAFLIAVNREIGSDLALALDFRKTPSNPRVIASVYVDQHDISKAEKSNLQQEQMHFWREVSPCFHEFVKTYIT